MIGIEAVQKLLKEDINSLNFEIPNEVFQFQFNRNESALHFKEHPEVPFILRLSSVPGYFALDIPARDRQSVGSCLIAQSKTDEKVFNHGYLVDEVFTEGSSLKEVVKKYWDPQQKCILSDSELAARKDQVWEQHKQLHQQQFEIRRKQEADQRHLRQLGEAQEKIWERLITSGCLEKFNAAIPEVKYGQKDFDRFMASGQQPNQQQGFGFFQGQAGQQSSQQRLSHDPQQTHHNKSESMNKSF